MISTKLLTNYILAPTWARIFIFLSFYFIILSISTNEIAFCADDIINKKKMVLIEYDRIKEYEDTIKANENMIKSKDQIIKDEKIKNSTTKALLETQLILLSLSVLVVGIKYLTKFLGY